MEGSRVRKVLVSAAGLLALIVIQSLCGMVSNALWLVGMAAAVAVMIFMTGYTLKLRPGMAVYTAARAFMRAELAAAFEGWEKMPVTELETFGGYTVYELNDPTALARDLA